MRKKLVFTASAMLCAAVTADNIFKNGSFDKDVKGVSSIETIYKTVDGKKKGDINKKVNYFKHNVEAGADGSKGCLEVDVAITKDAVVYPNNTGIILTADKRVPGSQKQPGKLKITMLIKSLDKKPCCLYISRLWGGGSSKVVQLTPEWQKVEAVIISPFPTSDLILVPVNKKKQVVSGKFLIDNVSMEAVKDK
jgi:hypothetical protein